MNKKTLILSLILLMAGICFGGATPTLDILLNGDFTDVLGPELVTNGDFADASVPSTWDGSEEKNLVGWQSDGTHSADAKFTIVDGECQLETLSVNAPISIGGLEIGTTYLGVIDVKDVSAGFMNLAGVGTYISLNSPGKVSFLFVADSVRMQIKRGGGATNITFDDVSIRKVLSPWIPSNDTDISGGNAQFTATSDTDQTILTQDTIALVDGATYKVYITISGVLLQDPTAYYGIQLGGGTIKSLTEAHTYDQAAPLYLVCGGTITEGLQISSVNTTTGDTITVDDISIIVEHFKPSTNLDSIIVTGDIKVPAGANLVTQGTFTPDDFDWTLGTGWSVSGSGGADHAAGTASAVTQTILTAGKTYLIKWRIDSISAGAAAPLVGTAEGLPEGAVGDYTEILTAIGTGVFGISCDAAFIGNVTNLEAYELTDGPIDEYPWDEFTVYDDAQNPGTFGGFRVYKSANTHADGSGGLVDWFVWNRNLSLNPGVTNFPRWAKASDGPIGDYMKRGGPPATLGTATTTYGPTDHSEESGSAGLGTDGSSGYIDLKTEYDYLNGLRDGKFGIVSVFEMITKNDASRVYSTETSSDVGMSLRSSTSNLRMLWNGTNGLSEIWPSDAGVLKCTLLTTDIGNSDDIWVFEDGAQVDTDDTVNGLIPGQSTLLTLASKAYTHTSTTETKFGPQILMDFADVIAVDAAWSLGLSQAINAVTSFDPHDIAAAIAAYDSNITGHYYANNELASGDASDYYLLAYDIETQTAITQGVYGLTSPSGVTGTVLVPVPVTGGNSIFGTKGSVLGPYRSIYTDTRKSWLGPVKSILGGN